MPADVFGLRWDPEYCVPTSSVVREWLEAEKLTCEQAAGKTDPKHRDFAFEVLHGITNHDAPVGEAEAALLYRVTGVNMHFWLNFEHQYRKGLAEGRALLDEH